MSITPVILVILTFIVNFIMDFSFWSVMLFLYYIGGAPAGTDDGTLLVKLTLASVLIPAILARLGGDGALLRLLRRREEGLW